ncbi:SanA/YdcF family protein [Halomonas cerina]|uniref:SanA protein n=1 Tax=Halomonas cerina TaxID=447424 RepID=A0A839V3U5_9GAMM|nr:ElyC/SanA/YdcF family protein [Halomonas cerina]MBB3189821.1 SanA protein [Halomonas cerina]
MRLPFWKVFKGILMSLGALALLATLLFAGANLWVIGATRERIEHDLASCRPERVGIVFGTSRWTRSGHRNPHFEGRMIAAHELLRLGRVDHLLLSGDNRTRYYNEPVAMWRDLRGRQVRDEDMTLDYAGFSTFDTLARARDVFGVERALLVTQAWHLPRALFIAEALGLEASGCVAPERPVTSLWRLKAREWVARVGTLGDLYLWQREPHFLGPQEPLEIMPSGLPNVDVSASGAASAGDTARGSTTGTPSSTPR